MSDRRDARRLTPAGGSDPSGLPAEMAMGPCIEVWAGDGSADQREFDPAGAYRARRNWAAAVDEWAVATGWAADRRPAMNARNLARTRHAWSKSFLVAEGRGDLVDFYEGRGPQPPGPTKEV